MDVALTKAMEAVKAASEALPVGAWEAQAKLLAAFDALADVRRETWARERFNVGRKAANHG